MSRIVATFAYPLQTLTVDSASVHLGEMSDLVPTSIEARPEPFFVLAR